MAIIELLFIVFKIIILSAIYATVVLITVFFISKKTSNQWVHNRMRRKVVFWLMTHFLISVLLFLITFSYWQDTGIGDNSRIPVGYGQTIQSEDFESTYFFPDLDKTASNKDEFMIGKYAIKDPFLCAEVSHDETNSPVYDYIVYDLKNKTMLNFYSEQEYIDYALKNTLPNSKSFYDFEKHYHEYLDEMPKWRTWFLP